jgi:two-component system response regulator AtoC
LLVVRDDETSIHTLPDDGQVLIGRAREADVRVEHGTVSREHARLHLGSRIQIEDLGSANGTRVRDTPLKQGTFAEVFPDDVIDLGAVLLVVQYRTLSQRFRRACPPALIELRVEEECERDGGKGPEFAVARLEVQGGLNTHAIQVLIASELESSDLITLSAPGRYELFLAETSPAEAEARVARAAERLTLREVKVRSHLACFPRDGRTPERLLARSAGLLTTPGGEPIPLERVRPRADVVVVDAAMLRVRRLIERVAESSLAVLLLGETGVGKEVLAELLHEASPRRKKPLLRLNCAAFAETLLESELFGHERGAFTGAVSEKAGLLEAASGGTVFLDEVGDMPLATQVKLLRVLDGKEVQRLGALRPRAIDIRVVAATHQDLQEAITEGRFREDLFHRLNGVAVLVPPLRDRPDDIAALSRHFLARWASAGKRAPSLSQAAVDWLLEYEFPGNVRELRNMIERAAVLADGPSIEPEHLSFEQGLRRRSDPDGPSNGLRGEVRALERERIEAALAATGGNQRRAAERLGISRGALLRRLAQLGIARSRVD